MKLGDREQERNLERDKKAREGLERALLEKIQILVQCMGLLVRGSLMSSILLGSP